MHLALHVIVPAIITLLFFHSDWKQAYIIMMLTMIVDADHLLATPIYDATRCSIGFHPLHKIIPILIYIGMSFIPKTRLIGIGLMIHMALDSIDCQMTNNVWFT